MFSHVFRKRPLTKFLHCCTTIALEKNTGRRCLFSGAYLKMPAFEQKKESIKKPWEYIGEKFLAQVENLVQDDKGIVFLGDVTLLTHAAKTDRELELVEKLFLNYVNQNKSTEGRQVTGAAANIMRMCHHLNDWKFACRLMQNEAMTTAEVFSTRAMCIFGDLLYENGQYDKLIELTRGWVQNNKIFGSLLFLLYATYLKQNTRESFENMVALEESHIKLGGSYINGVYLGALLALRQNEPKVAHDLISLLQNSDSHKYTTTQLMVEMWAEAELGDSDKCIAIAEQVKSKLGIVHLPIFERLLKGNAFVMDQDLITSIKAAVSRFEDVSKRESCLSLIASVAASVVIEPGSIDKALLRVRQRRPLDTHSHSVDFDEKDNTVEAHL